MNHGKEAIPEPQDKLHLFVTRLNDLFWFTLGLVSHPVKTVLSQLSKEDDKERIREAVYFLVAMLLLWYVIEVPLFLWRGIKSATLNGFLFLVVQFVFYFLTSTLYAVVLHLTLRALRVRSDLPHTIPCFFYASGVIIPLYAVLIYPSELVKYRVVDRAARIEVLLHPVEYSRIESEVLQQLGRRWEIFLSVSQMVTSIWSIVVFVFLSVILSKWYWRTQWSWTRYLRCLAATGLVYVFISVLERFLEPVFVHLEVLFSG
jgi:hypothetical protein